MHKSDCLVCGKELVYNAKSHEVMECYFCKGSFESNVKCKVDHFICDGCHGGTALEIIDKYCLTTDLKDPVEIVNNLMLTPAIKMHGPEHHYLVPAALLTSYYHTINKTHLLENKLEQARERSKTVVGGSCGFYGTCGAAVGTGIFLCLISNATPLSVEEWQLSNRMTATALLKIADAGGPRCCKRNTFIGIREAVMFVNEHFNTGIPVAASIQCKFHHLNRECLAEMCQFFPK